MKLIYRLGLALGLAALFTACHPENVTRVPGYGSNQGLADADKFPPINTNAMADVQSKEGIPLSNPDDRVNWPRNREIFKKDTVYFDFDSSHIKAAEKPKVARVADYLKSNPTWFVAPGWD